MKRFVLWVLYCVCSVSAIGQTLSFSELLNLTSYNPDKIQHYLGKRGFRPLEHQPEFTRFAYAGSRKDSALPERSLTRFTQRNKSMLAVEKLTAAEYADLKEKIKKEGFSAGQLPGKTYTEIFQKDDVTITASAAIDLDAQLRLYNIVIEKKWLPRARDLQYAEDLLQFDSHEHLAAVFGAGRVITDEFLESDGRRINCSVLFPNTREEAIFLWSDAANYRSLACIRIGGNPQTVKSLQYDRPVEQNQWVSNKGIFSTMTLTQLDRLNGAPVQFYGWGWQQGGELVADNKGRVDFQHLKVQFNCFNCSEQKYQGRRINSSATALEENKRVYIATLMLYPEPEKSNAVAQVQY